MTEFKDITPEQYRCSMSMACPKVERSEDGKTYRITGNHVRNDICIIRNKCEATIEIPAEILEGALGCRADDGDLITFEHEPTEIFKQLMAEADANEALCQAKSSDEAVSSSPSALQSGTELVAENTRLRAALARSKDPCVYCSLPAEKWAECRSGFPGCARADDMMGCPELGASMEAQELRAEIAKLAQNQANLVALVIKLSRRLDRAGLDPDHVQKAMNYLARADLMPSPHRGSPDVAPETPEASGPAPLLPNHQTPASAPRRPQNPMPDLERAREIANAPSWKEHGGTYRIEPGFLEDLILSALTAVREEEQAIAALERRARG